MIVPSLKTASAVTIAGAVPSHMTRPVCLPAEVPQTQHRYVPDIPLCVDRVESARNQMRDIMGFGRGNMLVILPKN